MALKRPSGPRSESGSGVLVIDPGPFSQYPLTWEFMTALVYEDGSRRQLPTLMLFLHDGRLTAALNDRDVGQTAFVSGTSVLDVLGALEGGLEADALQWRPNAKGYGQKKLKNST